MLFTAIYDPAMIATAKVYADALRNSGVIIIVVGLAQPDSTTLGVLGDVFYLSRDYRVPTIDSITSNTCSFATLNPYTESPHSTSRPYDPRSDAIGTACSTNTSNAWLDVVFVVDTSSAMSSRDLLELGGEIATFMHGFTFGQSGDHTTRAAIVTYATEVYSQYNLTDTTTFLAFEQAILKLQNYANPDDNGGNVQG